MPKAIKYTADSIIYFSQNTDYRIFILQSGVVNLSSIDIETGREVNELVKAGEFFGVKSALGRFPREETARSVTTTVVIALTVQEFENIFVNNKNLIMKMLRVFSNQLRQVHKKTESVLNNISTDQQSGMLSLAKSFYNDEQFRSASDVYAKILRRYPNSARQPEILKLYQESKLKAERLAELDGEADFNDDIDNSSVKLFALPSAFERFAKVYEPGQVIIAEFEPGDSFYLIQRGNVQLIKCVNETKKNLDILKPGEIFGEIYGEDAKNEVFSSRNTYDAMVQVINNGTPEQEQNFREAMGGWDVPDDMIYAINECVNKVVTRKLRNR